MSEPNSNATAYTRAALLADIWAFLVGIFRTELRAHTIQRPADRAFISNVSYRLDILCEKWRQNAPRVCESSDCEAIVTEPLDVLCSSCKRGGTPSIETRQTILGNMSNIEPDRTRRIWSNLEHDAHDQRKQVLTMRVCDVLRDTVTVRFTSPESASVEFTDASARVLSPLIEAVDILEAILWASDECVGHSSCAHSMEPWHRARTLLASKWKG